MTEAAVIIALCIVAAVIAADYVKKNPGPKYDPETGVYWRDGRPMRFIWDEESQRYRLIRYNPESKRWDEVDHAEIRASRKTYPDLKTALDMANADDNDD